MFLGTFRGLTSEALGSEVPANIATLADLKTWIEAESPALRAAMSVSRTQVVLNNGSGHDLAHEFRDGDAVAFLPPMCGGMSGPSRRCRVYLLSEQVPSPRSRRDGKRRGRSPPV